MALFADLQNDRIDLDGIDMARLGAQRRGDVVAGAGADDGDIVENRMGLVGKIVVVGERSGRCCYTGEKSRMC